MTRLFVILIPQFVIVAVINAQNIGPLPNKTKGCHLTLNNDDYDMEPQGDPLLFHVRITMRRLTEIPEKGGSFSVDIK